MASRFLISLLVLLCPQLLSAADQVSPSEEDAYVQQLSSLGWVKGPISVDVAGNSKLRVPAGYVFLGPVDTKKFNEFNQNFGNGQEVMIAPESLEWSVYLKFAAGGYVKDDEKIDSADLLKTLQENNESANPERKRRGWPELHVIDWAVPPKYNATLKRLEWASLLDAEGSRSVNFQTKVLGRRGHTSVILVVRPNGLATARSALDRLLQGYTFNSGETYAEWVPGEKVAEYGLAALVLGGAAAVATKKGFWAVLAGFLGVAWKFIAAGVVGIGAWIKSRFSKKTA